jgi:hypothetical protein
MPKLPVKPGSHPMKLHERQWSDIAAPVNQGRTPAAARHHQPVSKQGPRAGVRSRTAA